MVNMDIQFKNGLSSWATYVLITLHHPLITSQAPRSLGLHAITALVGDPGCLNMWRWPMCQKPFETLDLVRFGVFWEQDFQWALLFFTSCWLEHHRLGF